MMLFSEKYILNKVELVSYLMENKTKPIFIVKNSGEIIYKITYKNINSIKILNFFNELEETISLESVLSSKYINNSKIYTLPGIINYLNLLDSNKNI